MRQILADENIPYVREAFAELGEVRTMPGRDMSAADVRHTDLLLVRSITKVNRDLLEGSGIRFVATATIGEDHIDKDYLNEKGIAFSSAPGCNANSVAQYITCALNELAKANRFAFKDMRLGIVGVGNVGSRVYRCAKALGMTCLLNDPPLARKTGDPKYRPIEELYDCNILTLHVPLTKEGPDATAHLVDYGFLQRLKPGVMLINTSRGPVVDGKALQRALDEGHVRAAVLDVWEGEPSVDVELLKRVFIGTPHIAGYSFDGKVNGTRQIYEAACAFLGVPATWDPAPLLPSSPCPHMTVDGNAAIMDILHQALVPIYDILGDDAAMRRLIDLPEAEQGAFFDRLRKEYPRRREFHNTRIKVLPENRAVENVLEGVGFSLDL